MSASNSDVFIDYTKDHWLAMYVNCCNGDMMNPYANHLAEVNNVQDVIAKEDICNSQGQLIIPKGSKIDGSAAEKVIKFKLLRPIESTIAIDKELNAQRLKARFASYLSMDPGFIALQQQYDIAKELDECCAEVCKFEILRQKLTVLSLQLPTVFNQALFCAWFSIAINTYEKNDEKTIKDSFIAAMSHDLGFLHISPDILSKKTPLSDAEFNQIHSHPIIAERILEDIPGISKEVVRAVSEHHENLDGSGYPKNKVGKQLCHISRLLNMLDSVNAIYTKHFLPRQSTLHDLVPIIKINEQSLYGKSARSLVFFLKKTNDRADFP